MNERPGWLERKLTIKNAVIAYAVIEAVALAVLLYYKWKSGRIE